MFETGDAFQVFKVIRKGIPDLTLKDTVSRPYFVEALGTL